MYDNINLRLSFPGYEVDMDIMQFCEVDASLSLWLNSTRMRGSTYTS